MTDNYITLFVKTSYLIKIKYELIEFCIFPYPITIISPLALFSRRYHLLVQLTNALNYCSAGFRLLLVEDFDFAL